MIPSLLEERNFRCKCKLVFTLLLHLYVYIEHEVIQCLIANLIAWNSFWNFFHLPLAIFLPGCEKHGIIYLQC